MFIRSLIRRVLCATILITNSQAIFADQPPPIQLELLTTFRMEFVEIQPGEPPFPKSFEMGSDHANANEKPARQVSITDPFSISKYEITQNLWESVMDKNPSRWKGERNSVEMLSFEEAVTFCKKVTAMLQDAKLISTDQVVRLPSEAEWEYCARAGTTTNYSFGDEAETLNNYAWSTHNAAGNDPPVGAKKPNPWGLYDTHGYLWEWCLDHGHENYESAPRDNTAWTIGGNSDQRVLRGGSWKDRSEKLTSSFRSIVSKDLRDDAVGLRCVLSKVKN